MDPYQVFLIAFFLLFVIIFLVSILLIWRYRKQKQDVIETARYLYSKALDELRQDPNNSNKREEALTLGRRYADLVREDKRTTFDEVALMNDLNAIQPTASIETVEVNKSADSPVSTEQRLNKLEHLRSEGLITDAEYQQHRSEIIDEI
jgi:cytochrome c-type biogenesis protein CcmH/NrfG